MWWSNDANLVVIVIIKFRLYVYFKVCGAKVEKHDQLHGVLWSFVDLKAFTEDLLRGVCQERTVMRHRPFVFKYQHRASKGLRSQEKHWALWKEKDFCLQTAFGSETAHIGFSLGLHPRSSGCCPALQILGLPVPIIARDNSSKINPSLCI